MTNLKALVAKLEASKLVAQLFRVVRIAGPALLTLAVTRNAEAAIAAGTAVEVAFRQVFPAQAKTVDAVVTAAASAPIPAVAEVAKAVESHTAA